MSRCMRHVARALELADQILDLADATTGTCEHDTCLILAGVLRDSVYKIRSEAARCRSGLMEANFSKGSTGSNHAA